jgi:hypothetical protein
MEIDQRERGLCGILHGHLTLRQVWALKKCIPVGACEISSLSLDILRALIQHHPETIEEYRLSLH